MEKNTTNLLNLSRGLAFAYRVGDFVEERIGQKIIENGHEAPVLEEGAMAYPRVWYRVPLAEGLSGDGSAYHIYLKAAHADKLVVFFSGGGVAWNAFTAARPVTGGKVAAGLPNFYWNNLRPFTQIININIGITETGNEANPFEDWSFVIITYTTGDFHVGDNDYAYTDKDTGESGVVHFHGYRNFLAAMEKAKAYFPAPKKLLIAGDSAGAFAVPALAAEVADNWYPDCHDVTCFSDSGQLLYDHWQETARDLWHTADDIWQAIRTPNITLDWYRRLYAKKGDSFRYLYACSTHDYLLSAYYNDVVHKEFTSDAEVQETFYEQFVEMLRSLREITPAFTFYINEFPNLMVMKRGMKGGTAHTCVREKIFYLPNREGVSMARWLADAVAGDAKDAGMGLLGAAL
ncbi:MAG: pectinacetylesterase family protein [Lachnospiraceae bacterium]|nr:pectinacetylesterase family protein [Lachnospiraceae bacterium]